MGGGVGFQRDNQLSTRNEVFRVGDMRAERDQVKTAELSARVMWRGEVLWRPFALQLCHFRLYRHIACSQFSDRKSCANGERKKTEDVGREARKEVISNELGSA